MLKAVIFDFDGVIVDSEPLHYEAFQEVLRPLGLEYSWEEYVAGYIGFDDRDAFTEAMRAVNRPANLPEIQHFIDEKATIFAGYVKAGRARVYPGVLDFIRHLSERYLLSICSGALMSDIEPVLHSHHLDEIFSNIVTADQVSKSKPHPESYQRAAELLISNGNGQAPGALSEIIAIEDTPTGLLSAQSAGLATVAITNTHSAEELTAADHIVNSYEELNHEVLIAVLSEAS